MTMGVVRRLRALARGGAVVAVAVLLMPGLAARQNRIDIVSPLAPELANYGKYDLGVRTLQATDRNRPDILNTRAGGATARADRTFTLEVWYPAIRSDAAAAAREYRTTTADPTVPVVLRGRAVRDAAPLKSDAPFPLVIVSHGYPGNRYLLSHLCENLASKGFVVVSIDHPDSTYADRALFGSTLYNRPFDQLFVLDEIARLSRTPGSFLGGLADATRTGLVGYSMGGYGAVSVGGARFSRASEAFPAAPPNGMLAERGTAAPTASVPDPRIKAIVAIGPWGMQVGFWDAEGLKSLTTPILVVAGSADDVSGYEKGPKAIFEGAINADRYLLTFVEAGHNAAAPIPAPEEAFAFSPSLKSYPYMHYADAVWDTTRMNNILAHFATAYFGMHLKGASDMRAYLEPGTAASGQAAESNPPSARAGWKGFKPRAERGLRLEHASSVQATPTGQPVPRREAE